MLNVWFPGRPRGKMEYHKEPIFILRLLQSPLKKMEIAIFVSNFIASLLLLEMIIFVIKKGRTRRHESMSKLS